MLWIILTVIAWVVGIYFLVYAASADASRRGREQAGQEKEGRSRPPEYHRDDTSVVEPEPSTLRLIGIGVLVLWLLLSLAFSLKQIDYGHVGVVYQFGDIIGQRGAGLQGIAPWQGMDIASVQVQRHKFENLGAFSQETQDVFSSVTLNYSVSPQAIQALYRDVGPDWFERLIEPRVQNFFKEETVKYKSVEVAPNRENLRLAVKEQLAKELAKYSITVDNFLIDNVDFRPEFKQAIESKMIATQDALREEQRIAQRRNEAEQKIEEAKGNAGKLRIEAQGQADANRAINESLTPLLIQFQALQKLAPNVQIVFLPSGQGIIIDPATILGGSKK